jgi:hypothetical protein
MQVDNPSPLLELLEGSSLAAARPKSVEAPGIAGYFSGYL